MTHNELRSKIQNASKDDDKEFQEIIMAVYDIGFLTEHKLGHAFGVSLASIRRWKEGKSSPHSFLRPYIFIYLIKKLQGAESK